MQEHVFKRFRNKHGISQSELGKQLALENPQARISHYETKRLQVPVEIAHAFIALADSLGESYALEDVYPRPESGQVA